MQYSSVLILALATIHQTTATPALPGQNQPGQGGMCFDNLPATNVTGLVAQGGFEHMLVCCPGIVSNGGKDGNVCLIGGDHCAVTAGSDGDLLTVGNCQATIPLFATDYAAQISSAYNAAGRPTTGINSALVTGIAHNADGGTSLATATGVPVTTASADIDIGGMPITGSVAAPTIPGVALASSSAGSTSGAPKTLGAMGASAMGLIVFVLGAALV